MTVSLPLGIAVDRFRGDVIAALGHSPMKVMGLAVSGGPDSMAMLWLAMHAFPGQVTVATVDHRLRPAGTREAAAVARWCADTDVPHATLTIASSPGPTGNVHAWARRQRYHLLREWAVRCGARTLATAHHADDQAETFLMRAGRGAGVAGLAGIRTRTDIDVLVPTGPTLVFDAYALPLVRPLLGWRRTELADVVRQAGLPTVNDPANADPTFERTRVRSWLADAPVDPAGIARAALRMAEADADLRAVAGWFWRERSRVPDGEDPDDELWLDIGDLPRELRRRLTREAIRTLRIRHGIMPNFDLATDIEPLLGSLEAGRRATQADVMVTPVGGVWRFAEAPPRRTG